MRAKVAIAGSGLAGLACAAALAARAETLLFERLPVIGGEHWEDARIRRLARQAELEGASFFPGSQVLRWNGTSALIVGERTRQIRLDALIVATGHRPYTRAELGIEGPRLAGIIPATVALHLLDFGAVFGRVPTVVGSSRWASELVQRLHLQRPRRISVVAPNGSTGRFEESETIEVFERARPLRAEGPARVAALVLEMADAEHVTLETDTVLLAHGRLPYRNIDGAISARPGVVFAQPAEHADEEDGVEAAGREAALQALGIVERPRTALEPPRRIGEPI